VRPRQLIGSGSYIAGRAEVNFPATFTSATGWAWPSEVEQFITLPNIGDLPDYISDQQLVIITNDGSLPYPDIGIIDYEFAFGGAGTVLELFGFDVALNLDDTVLRNDGIHFSGGIQISDIPLIEQASLELEKLRIGLDGSVREATIELDPSPELSLANWDMSLNSGMLMETGLLLGGALMIALPGSDIAELAFSELGISDGQLHGGQFTFPVDGVDIFGIASFRSVPGNDITFGKVQNENVFYIAGGAVLGLPQYIDRELVFNDFRIRTDGQFHASIAANFEVDFFGLADLSINGVRFQNTSSPEIRVDGQFGLHAIPFISAQAGGLTYRPGGSVSVDQIDLGFEIVGVAQAQIGIEFIDDGAVRGFSGHGMLNVMTTPINAGVQFQYLRQEGGITFGAEFQAGLPPIPVGNFAIENIGGGFTYSSGSGDYSVTVSGMVTIMPGTGSAISLNPLAVTVRSGPVIEGTAGISVLTESLAEVSVLIDFPNQLFDVLADLSFSQFEDIDAVALDRRARLVISGDPDNQFWMAGALMNARLMNLFDANANILAVWNMNFGANPQYSEFTSFVSSDFIHDGLASGLFLEVGVQFGVPESDKVCYSIGWERFGLTAEGCGYFWNDTQCRISADIAGSQFALYMGSDWEAGGHISAFGHQLLSVDAWANGEITGLYSNNQWSANGIAQGSIRGTVLSCDGSEGCNSWCNTTVGPFPSGVNFCASGSISVDYTSTQGMNVSASLSGE